MKLQYRICWKANVVTENLLITKICLTFCFSRYMPITMFIRETIKRRKNKIYIQHKLVESVRTPNGPRQKNVLNLGRLDLPKDKWKELADAIEDELHGQQNLFIDPEINNLAKHYAKLIIKERLKDQIDSKPEVESQSEDEQPEYESVDINSVSNSDSRSIGCEHIVVKQLEDYKFDHILNKLGFENKQIDYAKMLVIGRLVHPASERETVRWIDEDSSISELIQSKGAVYDNALHRTAVMIWENHDVIEQQLSEVERDIFRLKETTILYDLTNTYFEGSKKGSVIAKHSKKSKDHRDDRPLMTLALTIDSDGFPKRSQILNGNISEPGTLEKMINELTQVTAGYSYEKTIVIDAGIASEENLKLLVAKKFKYLAVSRKQSYGDSFWEDAQEKEIKLSDNKTKLKTKLIKTDKELFLECYSPLKEAKERGILERKTRKFEQDLEAINNGLNKKNTQKKYDNIIERIGRLKEKYGVGNLYNIEVEQIEGRATKITFIKNSNGKAKELKLGKYVLRTNRLDLNEEEISKIHRALTTVEDSFRSMKSHLGLRPIHHKRDEASVAHLFISVIAYHIMIGILKKLRAASINYNWSTIRAVFNSHNRVTTSFKTKRGTVVNVRACTTPTKKQKEIYKALNISQRPLKRVKIETPLIEKTAKKM